MFLRKTRINEFMEGQTMVKEDILDFSLEESEEFVDEDRICKSCGGSGRDKWSDGLFECQECDGEGYLWWY